MMIARALVPILTVLFGALPALAEAPAPQLRQQVTVTGEIVRLGDLVDNAGSLSDVAVFRAPDPGHTGAVPAWRVIDAARRAGLERLSAGNQQEISVTRAARIVPLADMEEAIALAVARSLGIADTGRIQISFDRGTRPIAVAPDVAGGLDVLRIDHDPRSGRFEAMLGMKGSDRANRNGFRVVGTANELVEFVVPARAIARGEVLKASDLVVDRRPRSEMGGTPADAVAALTQAVGLAARRPLVPERAFRASDLMRPELVERNGNVLIVYELGGLTLTIRGKALEAGAQGDIVQVQNPQSRKTLAAVVTGQGRVLVQQRQAPAAAVVASTAPSSPLPSP
jgi:flagella basal body P-ring formation protein FlgA